MTPMDDLDLDLQYLFFFLVIFTISFDSFAFTYKNFDLIKTKADAVHVVIVASSMAVSFAQTVILLVKIIRE